jgi:hypothetical protein
VWGASVLVAYINLLIRGAKVKGQTILQKSAQHLKWITDVEISRLV